MPFSVKEGLKLSPKFISKDRMAEYSGGSTRASADA